MDNPALYFLLMLVLLQLQWGLILRLSPYRLPQDNRLALLSLTGLLVAAACGLFVSAAGNGMARTVGTGDGVAVVQGTAAAVNVVVLVWVLVEAGSGVPWMRTLRALRALCCTVGGTASSG